MATSVNIVSKAKRQLALLRGRKARQRAVLDFRRSLALIVDPDALEASVAMRLKELFDPSVLVFLHLDSQRQLYRAGFRSGLVDTEIDASDITPKGRLARWFLVNESCLLLPQDRGVLAFLQESEQKFLNHLQIQMCAPLLARNHVAGMLLLGKINGEWSPLRRDADLLMDLANQASLAFQNVALYREQQERLEALYRADRLATVGQLTASIAHEVGNPLTAIRSTVQYLMGRLDDEDTNRELVEEVLDEVDRIRQTIDGMLALTRNQNFETTPVEIAGLVRQAVQLVAAKARQQSVSFEHSHQPSLRVEADVNLLRQVFLNLLLNALQAMTDGGHIRLSTALEEHPDGDRHIRIDIADNGPGIPPDDLPRIFDRFFTTRRDGTGLGLAICRQIVQLHQGTIEVTSEEGDGTTVSITLPRRHEPSGS